MIYYSIIIPTRNIPQLLDRCISSIPNRSDIQIIVVDDNSDPSIVDFDHYLKCNKPNVELILTKDGLGAGYARNIGLRYAKGKWIIFADSDDFFVDNFITLLDYYKNSEQDIVYFKTISVDSDTLEPASRAIGFNQYIDKYLQGKISSLELGLNYCVPWGKIISRKLIFDKKLSFSETKAANDVYFSTALSLATKNVAVDSSNLYCITQRQGSLTTTPSLNLIYDRLNERLKRNELLIETGNGKHIGSVAYLIYSIYKVAGYREVFKAIKIVKKSRTPLMTGCCRWLMTVVYLKKNNIAAQNF